MSRRPGTGDIDAPGHFPAATSGSVVVLLVEADRGVAAWIANVLAGWSEGASRFEWVTRLSAASERLRHGDVDVVLIGSSSPRCDAREALDHIRRATNDALILPLNEVGCARGPVPDGDEEGGDRRASEARWDGRWLSDVLHYVGQRKAAMTVLRETDEILFEAKERAQVTLSSIGDAVLVTDVAGNVTYLNPIAEALTGWPCVEATGRALTDVFAIIDGTTRAPATNPVQRAIEADETVELAAHCVLLRRDGSELGIEDSAAPIHDRQGRVAGAVIVFRDVSQSRAMTRKMAYLAQHDALTGLPNRVLLDERLGQALRMADRGGHKVGLLFVDLNDFKAINDTMGHLVGDQALRTVAERLTSRIRTTDTVCRQGGDEFVVLLPQINTRGDAVRFADKLSRAIEEPLLTVDGNDLPMTVSIGIGVYPDDGTDREAIMRHADADMYRTREGGGERHGSSLADADGRPTWYKDGPPRQRP
jgi:diguanylate cyclase (GGDEF)-like protein/PAS domain S-box-containing protein